MNRNNDDLVFKKLINLINEVMESSEIDKEKIIRSRCSTAWYSKCKDRESIHSLYYGWKNINIKEDLEEELELTCVCRQ